MALVCPVEGRLASSAIAEEKGIRCQRSMLPDLWLRLSVPASADVCLYQLAQRRLRTRLLGCFTPQVVCSASALRWLIRLSIELCLYVTETRSLYAVCSEHRQQRWAGPPTIQSAKGFV